MRILSLGFPLPGPQVHNHSFASAPCFFDYDALVVQPLALSQLIEEVVSGSAEHTTYDRQRVVNAPTTADAVSLADVLRARKDETNRLLERGGIVVCFAYPNVPHEDVACFRECDRYYWLPEPAGIEYREPWLRRGEGTEFVVTEHEHPLGPFLQQYQRQLAYHAYVADDADGFAEVGRVFARSTGGAAVGVEFALAHSRVIFLPLPVRVPGGNARYAFSNALQAGIRQALGQAAALQPPAWLRDYDLPGLSDSRSAVTKAKQQTAQTQEALAEDERAYEELDRYRRLLWQEGTYGLEQPVRDALALLGFRIIANDVDEPAELWLEGDRNTRRILALETDASSEAVGLNGHYRLRRRLEEAIAQGKEMRGLLVINGFRTDHPRQREAQCEDALRVAAESMRYCIATTEQLFHATRAALEGDQETAGAFRERLLTTEGVLTDN